jgi:hypothetical protein
MTKGIGPEFKPQCLKTKEEEEKTITINTQCGGKCQ